MSDTNMNQPPRADAMGGQSAKEPPATLVYTRCVFFRGEDTTMLERQVNYFLTYASLAALHNTETSVAGEEVIITLWFEPMPGCAVDSVYRDAIALGEP